MYDGWYRKLMYGTILVQAEHTKDYTIADVHTKPYDVNRVSAKGEPLIRMTDEEWIKAVGDKSDIVVRPAWARPFLGP